MRITMLGVSGAGKTCYMSAMSQLFYHSVTNGFYLKDRGHKSDGYFNHRTFEDINTIISDSSWPDGTATTTNMQLSLEHEGVHVMEIDWIDYKGGLVDEIDKGNFDEEAAILETILLASDVILVFIDAIVLKNENNIYKVKHLIGANAISRLLTSIVRTNNNCNIVFLLSKVGSDLIKMENDYSTLLQKSRNAYDVFFSQLGNANIKCPFIPIDCVGFNKVITRVIEDERRNKCYQADIMADIEPYNIDVSFAYALTQCLIKKRSYNEENFLRVRKRLSELESNFGSIKQIIDILFRRSKRRLEILTQKDNYNMYLQEYDNLKRYEKDLLEIWEGKI